MSEQLNDEKKQKQSPGKILVAARQALNIDLVDLAKQIKVPLHVLEAIEKDRIPKNLPETFVRGYIRSYAKKVNVAEDLVLLEVETKGVVFDESDKEMQSFSRRTKRKALERRLSFVTWIFALVVIAALGFWWIQDNQYSDFAPVAGDDDDHIIVAANEVKAVVPVKPPAISDEESSTIAAATQTVAAEELPKFEETAVPVNNIQRPVELNASQKSMVADNGTVDEEGFVNVEMRFENECWVEVYDVNGDRIAVGNKPSGYVMSLNAQGPLSVSLGKPEGVSVFVNGKEYSLADLPKNRVARFELEAL
ncbi:RodZ domain-containing protein [uncultured Psychrosphaera sp.]|uniref:RodZ domain-containing protein n=1 Tax=uncultured Psychrosphaera sp. TaxID=1403522 RepID=UPI00260FE97C|nr:RodZ domain-containing protein [uncultured Psychrosphaera sp.]